MKLAIFNGSPRRKKSNSKILTEQFLRGYTEIPGNEYSVNYLMAANMQDMARIYQEADTIIIIFPLYTDCMPGIVKMFFEEINSLSDSSSKNIGFIVQSGFPEAIHSTFVEKYLEKFTRRMSGNYLGTVIKGGIEGIQEVPPGRNKKLFNAFFKLGYDFAKTGAFNEQVIQKLRKPYKLSVWLRAIIYVFYLFGATNFYWNKMLKQNKAYNDRYAQPYLVD